MEIIKPYLLAFIPIFVAIDVLGLLPMYMFLTEDLEKDEKDRTIVLSIITALIVSIGFVFVGKGVFLVLGIRVADFLVAGGILLFIIAINNILTEEKKEKQRLSSKLLGIVPLGTPLIIGPAVFTATLIVLDTRGILPTLTGIFLNIILVGVVFKMSNFLMQKIGVTGMQVISKLTSIMLSAYAVMMIRRGIAEIIAFYTG